MPFLPVQRRIEAVTGEEAFNVVLAQQSLLTQSAELLKSDLPSIVEKIQQLQDRAKKLEKELQQLKEKSAVQAVSDLAQKAQTINGVKVVIESVSGVEPKSLRIHGR